MKTRSPLESSGALPPVTRSSWVSFRRVPSPPHAGDPPRTTIRERTMTPSVSFIKRGLPSLCRRVDKVLPGAAGITLPPPAPHYTCLHLPPYSKLLTRNLLLSFTRTCPFA